jgi:hypothetical protein
MDGKTEDVQLTLPSPEQFIPLEAALQAIGRQNSYKTSR